MKTSAILLTILLLTAATAARAQDNTPITNTGARNLMFSFGGLSTMTAGPYLATKAGGTGDSAGLIPTYGIGYRYFLNNNLALRATLGFAMNNNDTKGTNGNSDATTDATAFGIGAGVEWHMAPVAAVSPYAGAELGFLTGSTKSTASVASGQTAPTSTASGSTFSISLIAGAEWFFNSAMSLGAEYQLGFTTSSSSVQASNGSSSTTTTGPSLTTIGTNSVSVILNVYIGK